MVHFTQKKEPQQGGAKLSHLFTIIFPLSLPSIKRFRFRTGSRRGRLFCPILLPLERIYIGSLTTTTWLL